MKSLCGFITPFLIRGFFLFFATTENSNWHIAPKKPCSIPQMPGYVSMSITIWKSIVWAMTWPMARFFLPGTYNNSNKTKHKIYMSHAKNRWAKELREKKERKNEPWNCEESLPLRGSRFNKFLISITGGRVGPTCFWLYYFLVWFLISTLTWTILN